MVLNREIILKRKSCKVYVLNSFGFELDFSRLFSVILSLFISFYYQHYKYIYVEILHLSNHLSTKMNLHFTAIRSRLLPHSFYNSTNPKIELRLVVSLRNIFYVKNNNYIRKSFFITFIIRFLLFPFFLQFIRICYVFVMDCISKPLLIA